MSKGDCVSKMSCQCFINQGKFVFVGKVKNGGDLLVGFGETVPLLYFFEVGAESLDERSDKIEQLLLV